MEVSPTFKSFLSNLSIPNKEKISHRYKKITKTLNQEYWNDDSDEKHSLMIGSYGRKTAIKDVSDLDMAFIIPYEVYKQYDGYEGNGQSALLQDVKSRIKKTYSDTDVKGDGQVVVIKFADYVIEVLPVFENKDNSFTHPDSNDGGRWRVTRPREEVSAIDSRNKRTNGNLKKLAKMVRAWKNKVGAPLGGLLIDTLCYNFFDSSNYDNTSYSKYDAMSRDFFDYLRSLDKDQKFWRAPGSNQPVYKAGDFIPKAKKAYNNCLAAIDVQSNNSANKKWKKVYGKYFPSATAKIESRSQFFRDTEEFIESKVQVDIRYNLQIDCSVSQTGFRTWKLTELISRNLPLKINKKLEFNIILCNVPEPYMVKWKVRNVGYIAESKDMIRGQIIPDGGRHKLTEKTNFKGEHYVECYVVKNDICVARDRIDVPISS